MALLPPPSSLVSQVWAMWPSFYKCPWFAVIRALALGLDEQHMQSKNKGCVSPGTSWAEESLPILPVEGMVISTTAYVCLK